MSDTLVDASPLPSPSPTASSSSPVDSDLVAAFHTSFHFTQGNSLDWSTSIDDEAFKDVLDGVEFSSLPSGLHDVEQDVLYVMVVSLWMGGTGPDSAHDLGISRGTDMKPSQCSYELRRLVKTSAEDFTWSPTGLSSVGLPLPHAYTLLVTNTPLQPSPPTHARGDMCPNSSKSRLAKL